MSNTTLQRWVVRRLKRVVVDRRLTYRDVAARAGVHAITVERFLEGERFRPETADAIALALHVQLFEDTEERLLNGLELWALDSSREWWARLVDAARHAGSTADAVRRRLARARETGVIGAHEIRPGVTASASIRPSRTNCALTASPRGVVMVTARVALWVLLTADSQRGDEARRALVDDGLDRMRRAGPAP